MNKELLHHTSRTFLFVFCCVQSQLRVRSREKRGLIYTARYTRDTLYNYRREILLRDWYRLDHRVIFALIN